MSNYELKPWQLETFKYNIKHPYCIDALGCGLGKSLTALHTCFHLGRKTLVVCPTYLKYNWVNEVKKFFPDKIVTVINSSKDIYALWDTDVAILSYGLAHKAEKIFEWSEAVVLDEGHYLKNMTSKRTQKLHQFIYENSPKNMYILTGTPLKNRVYELYSLMSLCYYHPSFEEPEFLRKFPTYIDFAEYFSYPTSFMVEYRGKKKKVVRYDGSRNLEELKRYLAPIFIRFDPSVLGLAEPIHKDVLMSDKSDPEIWEAFQSYNKENSSVNPTLKAEVALKKVPFTVEYAEDLLEHYEKVVIFTDHVESAKTLAEKLGCVAITGDTSTLDRSRMAANFSERNVRVLVATIGSFSTGSNLVGAHHMVFNDLPWVPGDLEQAQYRINRIGQTKTCVYHYILGSIQDGYIANTLREKKTVIKEVLE